MQKITTPSVIMVYLCSNSFVKSHGQDSNMRQHFKLYLSTTVLDIRVRKGSVSLNKKT